MGIRSFFFAAALLATSALPAAAAALSIVNGTHFAVLAVRIKAHGPGQWRADLLQQNTLGIGQIRRAGLPNGYPCNDDLLAILSDGHKIFIANYNICRNGTVSVIDDRH